MKDCMVCGQPFTPIDNDNNVCQTCMRKGYWQVIITGTTKELLKELQGFLPLDGCDCHPEMSKLMKVLRTQEKGIAP